MSTPSTAPPFTPAWQKWHNCGDHLWRLMEGLPLETRRRLCHDPAVVQAETRAAELARSGDVLATNSACNVWLRTLQAALKTHAPHEEAA